jgi:acetyl esterase/lipase
VERGIVQALTLLGVYAWHPVQVALQTLLLLPAVFPGSPVDALALQAAPTHETMTLGYVGGTIQADLFRPARDGRHGAIVLLLGAGDLPRIDVAFHFADELARSGAIVLIPQSEGLLQERLSYAEVDAIRSEVALLDGRTDVDPARVGVIGLSAAGGLSIVAAAEPDLRERITFVNSFGSYNDAQSLIVDVASQSIDVGGELRNWTPEERTHEVVAISLIDTLGRDSDRVLLQRAFVAHETIDDWSALSADAAPVKELLSGTTRQQAEHDVALLPAEAQAKLRQISPADHLRDVRARLYVMHDLDDPFIPFTESRALVEEAPPGLIERYTEFSIFAHVIPERSVPWQTFVPDVWRLFWHVDAVLLELI